MVFYLVFKKLKKIEKYDRKLKPFQKEFFFFLNFHNMIYKPWL